MQQATIERRVCLRQFRQFCAVGKEDVHLAIVVIVKNGDASAHRLRKVLATGEIVVRPVAEV
jgi:hypothetical protein